MEVELYDVDEVLENLMGLGATGGATFFGCTSVLCEDGAEVPAGLLV